MRIEPPVDRREPLTQTIDCDLVVVGGGMAGTCCAITAARAGIRVTLIQDRPLLGGNASSEVRLWILGATSHMGNNNRWAREGGVIGEILVENLFRNPEGNALIFDTILLEKVREEANLTLLLNCMVYEVCKAEPDRIEAVRAFCSQNSTRYEARAPLFVDASGDGLVGFLSGAAFRMGAEAYEEFEEKLAPTREYGELLGHSLYFYSKDTGKPVKFVPPSFALKDITRIPRYRSFTPREHGCRLWWVEFGGRLDTVYDTEEIKWELWKIIYGVWDYLKNSGNFPETENYTLEWVGALPGKRESRRFEGDYILRQQDIIEQRRFSDAVSYGGWSLDLHPADGIYSEKPGCNQWHSRGVYQIPYRCLYSRNITNLFLAGRIISVSHVAFGSTRVQATLAQAAQAVGLAAVLCLRHGCLPAAVARSILIQELQRDLLRRGQFIPGVCLEDPDDLTRLAYITASSQLLLGQLPQGGMPLALEHSWAQMLPLPAGPIPRFEFTFDAAERTDLRVELRTGDRPDNYTPDTVLDACTIVVPAGSGRPIQVHFEAVISEPRYVFICLMRNPALSVYTSSLRLTGVLSVANKQVPAVSNFGKQVPQEDIGVESFEFWCPQRRPEGRNLALKIDPPLALFEPGNVSNGWARPTAGPNAWVADPADPAPTLSIRWDTPQVVARIELGFDADFDHPMETVLLGHPENVVPFCVRRYRITDGAGQVLVECAENHQALNFIHLSPAVKTDQINIEFLETGAGVPAAVFEVRCYSN